MTNSRETGSTYQGHFELRRGRGDKIWLIKCSPRQSLISTFTGIRFCLIL